MEKKKISLNLGGLKLGGSTSSQTHDDPGTSGFGSFGKKEPEKLVKEKDNVELVAESEENLYKVMGFSGFGDSKKAKQFDMGKILEEARSKAIERNAEKNLELESSAASIFEQTSSRKSTEKNKEKKLEKTSATPPIKPKNDEDNSSDDDFIGPPIPETLKKSDPQPSSSKSAEQNDSNESSDDEEEDDITKRIPTSHEVQLSHGDRSITSLAIDPAGTRLISGGIDYEIKFWDFGGMDSNLKSFRQLKPCESHVIRNLEYSSTGDKILVVAANSQAKVLDRDGHQISECVKGDPYVIDVGRNKGHVSALTSGAWHPKIRDEYLTASHDNSLRIWMVGTPAHEGSKYCIKTKSKKSGLKTIPTACTFSRDGLLVAAACQDGSIQMWDHRKTFVNVTLQHQDCHTKGTDTSSIVFAYDNHHVATRGGDDTLKLWDIRKFKSPVHVKSDLFSRFDVTECCFSPDDRMVVTGTSMGKNEKAGRLIFYNKDTFEKVSDLEINDAHIIRSRWHPKLNQILIGGGDGIVRVFYDPNKSHNGAKLCVVRKPSKVKQTSYVANQHIITPYSLPLFREDRQRSTKRQEEKARKDPLKSKRPDMPLGMKGTGGRVTSGGSTLHSWMAKQISVKNKDDHIDPRERILRHAKESEENPYWIDPAYKEMYKDKNKTIFRDPSEGEPAEKKTRTETFG